MLAALCGIDEGRKMRGTTTRILRWRLGPPMAGRAPHPAKTPAPGSGNLETSADCTAAAYSGHPSRQTPQAWTPGSI